MNTSSFPQRHPERPRPPVPPLASAERTEPRDDGRSQEFIRHTPAEPHEKYDIPEHRRVRGMSYLWASKFEARTTITSRRLEAYMNAGYHFVRAADMPELSRFKPNTEANQRLVQLGFAKDVQADDPTELDGMVLLYRPSHLTAEAEDELSRRAKRQINDHLRKTREDSERQIGANRTVMRQNFAPPDEAPSDSETEI